MAIIPIKGLPIKAADELTINSRGELIYRTKVTYKESEGFDNRHGIVLHNKAVGAIAGLLGVELLIIAKVKSRINDNEIDIILITVSRATAEITGIQLMAIDNQAIYWILKSIGDPVHNSLDILPFKFYTGEDDVCKESEARDK